MRITINADATNPAVRIFLFYKELINSTHNQLWFAGIKKESLHALLKY